MTLILKHILGCVFPIIVQEHSDKCEEKRVLAEVCNSGERLRTFMSNAILPFSEKMWRTSTSYLAQAVLCYGVSERSDSKMLKG